MSLRLKRSGGALLGTTLAVMLAAVMLALSPAVAEAQTEDKNTSSVVIRPGDSLWSISEGRLGPNASPQRILAYVQRTYARNRNTIGANPNLIFPGQELSLPRMPDRAKAERVSKPASEQAPPKRFAKPAAKEAIPKPAGQAESAEAVPRRLPELAHMPAPGPSYAGAPAPTNRFVERMLEWGEYLGSPLLVLTSYLLLVLVALTGIRILLRATERSKRIQHEPITDWSFGILTGHRLRVVSYLITGIVALYGLQSLLWPASSRPNTIIEHVWSWGSLLWLGAVIPGICGLIGMLTFRYPNNSEKVMSLKNPSHARGVGAGVSSRPLVAWRIVSRGTNVEALTDTIRRCQAEMATTPLFPYIIEVVTDTASMALPPPNKDLRYIVVPQHYCTPNKSLFKARALQYALEYSPLPDDAWIVHLDEETQPTASGITGIWAMICEEETSGELRIGQGAILYHRKWREHPILTLADNVRTGDDFARFHFQHRLGVTVFGLHGSYIVTRNDVEKSIGFDFGPQGSITEDAFWALVAMEQGYRCRWVDGYLEEQSTQSAGDFVRQRRRWYQGLAKVSIYAPAKLRWRLPLGINTCLWTLAPFALLYTLGHLFYGVSHEWWLRALANFSFASFGTLYLMGLKANLDEYGVQRWFERAGWYLAQLILFPIFTLLEGLGVLAAIFRPVAGFHVVKK